MYRSIILLLSCISLCIGYDSKQCRLSNNCSCEPSPLNTDYEFHCPEEEPVPLAIRIKPRDKVLTILCETEINWETQNLPSIVLGDIESAQILQCPFPKSIHYNVMKKLGINSIKIFKLSNSAYGKNVNLTSEFFKEIKGLEKLVLDTNNIQNIDEDVFMHLTELVELQVKFNNIQLWANLFNHLTKLELLELSGNGFSQLPQGVFDNLTRLGHLSLRSNKLTSIESDAFKSLSNLTLLELSNNKLTYIAEDAFFSLRNLKTISLSENELQYIPGSLFMNTKSLTNIKIFRNPNLILPSGLFSNLSQLESVELFECEIKNLPEKLFDGLINAKEIYLENNKIEEIPNHLFKDLTQLQKLDLSYNKLTDLPEEIFFTNTKLTNLNLANNLLTQIRNTFFENLSNLEILNLKNNRISAIETYSFGNVQNLKEIILSYNYIDLNNQATALFTSNKALRKIDFSHNNITVISADIGQMLSKLTNLDLSYNQLSSIKFSDMLTASPQITIDLSHNNINTIDYANAINASKENPTVNGERIVLLHENPINCNCRINDLIHFIKLVKNNKINSLVNINLNNVKCMLPEKYVNVPVVDLNLNMLTCLPEELGITAQVPDNCTSYEIRPADRSLIVNCKEVNLTKIPVLSIPDSDTYDEVEVHLEGNQLTSAPVEDMGYEMVTKLYLSSNNINEIAWVPPNIKVLELHNNNISRIDYNILSFLNSSSFTNLTLGDNAWICDCATTNLTNFLTSSNIAHKHIDVNNITCKNSGKHIISLKEETLCPNYQAYIYVLVISILLPIVTLCVLYSLYCYFKEEIKVWLYAHNMFLWFVAEEELDKDKKYDAFISYSHEDEEFVLKQLQPVLENNLNSYKLCLHIRDWVAGEFISKQIVDSVANSRRTIVILSRNFLESDWGKMEFRIAHKQALEEGRARVILVIYGEIDLNKDLDDEFKAYIKTNTYVKWGDPWFWDKLRYALPHTHKRQTRKQKNLMLTIRNKIGRIGDKIDLIHTPSVTPIPASTPPALSLDPLLAKKSPLDFTFTEAV